jgi:hypothetical protein
MRSRLTTRATAVRRPDRTSRGDRGAAPRVLSLKQPWAWAVATRKKKVENRSWSTSYRGTVYIHASLKVDRTALDWLRDEAGVNAPADFVHGAVVALAETVDVVTKRDAAKSAPWFFGPYGFVLKKIRRLPIPIPEKGRLGLARASPALQRRVARALRR